MFIVNRIVVFLNWIAVGALLLAYSSTWISPESFILPAFFGLAFPLILLVNLVFLVYWFIFGKFRMLYSGTALVLGFSYWNRCFNLLGSDTVPADAGEQSRIMSYNVRLFDLYNWTDNNKTKEKIFDFLKQENPDIICFQEFFNQEPPTDFVTREKLKKILKANHVAEAYTHKLIQRQYFGLAVFSIYPILQKGEIKFENDNNNNALWVDIKRKTDTIRVYNVHLSSIRFQPQDYAALGEEAGPGQMKKTELEQRIFSRLKTAFIKRVQQTQKVLEHVKKSPYQTVVCGDFNDTPVSYCYAQFNQYLTDAFTVSGSGWGSTYTGKLPLLRIDYIWHTEQLNSTAFKVHDINLSDHYPVSCIVY